MKARVLSKKPEEKSQNLKSGNDFDSAMNTPEVQSAKKADDSAVNEAPVKRLNLLLGLVSQKFNLDESYTVHQFNDKGKVMNITLENEEFSVVVSVKDSERHGLVV